MIKVGLIFLNGDTPPLAYPILHTERLIWVLTVWHMRHLFVSNMGFGRKDWKGLEIARETTRWLRVFAALLEED